MEYLKERHQKENADDLDVFCPVEFDEEGKARVVVGLTLLTDHPDGPVLGEFWWENGGIKIELYPKEDVTRRR